MSLGATKDVGWAARVLSQRLGRNVREERFCQTKFQDGRLCWEFRVLGKIYRVFRDGTVKLHANSRY